MRKDLTDKLSEDFPVLYAGRKMSLTENLMPFGFECGDGWYEPIRKLSAKIEEYNKEHPKEPVIAMQVKEKFGGLRFYLVTRAPDVVHGWIEDCENECDKHCEECGATEELGYTTKGWCSRLCYPCAVRTKVDGVFVKGDRT